VSREEQLASLWQSLYENVGALMLAFAEASEFGEALDRQLSVRLNQFESDEHRALQLLTYCNAEDRVD
jgi:hypothetical protein